MHGSNPFSDLGDYLAIPRLTSLCLSPDGQWLAATVQALGPEPKKFTTSIWRIETAGAAAPIRLTRSAHGESGPRFLPDGSLLFISKRTEPGAKRDPDEEAALWLLPAAGGEACRLAAPPGGADGLEVARNAPAYLLSAPAFAGTVGAEEDAARRKARADAGVTAILHETSMIRFWDHDLGPDELRLLAGTVPGTPGAVTGTSGAAQPSTGADAGADAPVDLTPEPGRALDDQEFCLSPGGTLAVTGWWVVDDDPGSLRSQIVAIDVRTAQRQVLCTAASADFGQPCLSPDGQLLVAVRSEHDTPQRPGDVTLVVAGLDDSGEAADHGHGTTEPRDLLPGFDRRPLTAAWAPDSRSVYFTADDNGRAPVFRVDIATGVVTKVTTDDAAYDNLCPAPDGRFLYALRSAIGEPPAPVRIDLGAPGEAPVRLASPAGQVEVPGQVREVSVAAGDGAQVRGWLVLPEGAGAQSKAPLLVWVHGGPMMSWNAWSWRWNPWLMAARGYAVLLPDPALSTGYGQGFIARGHARWGEAPYTDVLAITDAVVALPEIDAGRTAMMGGSFGGYMANWIAGHTDRFAAIVSHAGLWALDQILSATDEPFFWRRTFGHPLTDPERYASNSPHLFAASVATPILIIHGDKDYRVPIGEALRMYSDLRRHGKYVKFLYFPDENHWITRPGGVRVWYETIFAFLAEHVLGATWQRPDLL